MRFILISIFLLAEIASSYAQVKHASLQAAGLTCAMCSNAIYQSLSSLPFIEEITPDVANSSFLIKFKPDQKIDPEKMRTAVEEAGFSIAELRITIGFTQFVLPQDKFYRVSGMNFFVVNGTDKSLDSDIVFVMLNKGYLTDKSLKEYEKKLGAKLKKNQKQIDPSLYSVMINQEGL